MKEQQQQGAGMDPRFAKMYSDPRFQRSPKKKAMVEIDSRFAGTWTLHACPAAAAAPTATSTQLSVCCLWTHVN